VSVFRHKWADLSPIKTESSAPDRALACDHRGHHRLPAETIREIHLRSSPYQQNDRRRESTLEVLEVGLFEVRLAWAKKHLPVFGWNRTYSPL